MGLKVGVKNCSSHCSVVQLQGITFSQMIPFLGFILNRLYYSFPEKGQKMIIPWFSIITNPLLVPVGVPAGESKADFSLELITLDLLVLAVLVLCSITMRTSAEIPVPGVCLGVELKRSL